MTHFLVLAHLVPVAKTPALNAQVFAIRSCKVIFEEFSECFERLLVLCGRYEFVFNAMVTRGLLTKIQRGTHP